MASESDQIKQLYDYSEKLDKAGTEAAKHLDIYKGILEGAKGAAKAKSLAAQLIPRYFKYFPELLEDGINALTDLCEEEDIQIRILAVRAFPAIGKDNPNAIPKSADILGQLLQTEVVIEQDNVKNSLVSLLHVDAKAVIKALFNQILNRDETQRERAFQFLRDKVYPLRETLLHPHEDVEKELAELIRKALADVSGEEFKIFMDFLSSLKIYQQNAKELLDILAEQADLKSDFKPTDTDNIERLIACMKLALPVFQRGATQSGQTFLNYLSNKVLPSFDKLSEAHQNGLLQAVAEISPYAVADDARILLPAVYALFKAHVPANQEGAQINYTYIEALLFTFHLLGSKAPGAVAQLCGVTPVYTGQPSDMVNVEGAAEKLKDFKERLQFLARKAEKSLGEMTAALKGVQMDKDKKKTVDQAMNTTKNIIELSKLLLHSPKPTFLNKLGTVQPSWKSKEGFKRKQPDSKPNVASESGGKKSKPTGFAGVYVPPGKQSGGKGVLPPDGNQRGRGFQQRGGGFQQRGGGGGFQQRGRGGFTPRGGRGGGRGRGR